MLWRADAIQFPLDCRNCVLSIIGKLEGCFVFCILARYLPCLRHPILEQLRRIASTEIKKMLGTLQVLSVTTLIEITKVVLDSFETGGIRVRNEVHGMHPV